MTCNDTPRIGEKWEVPEFIIEIFGRNIYNEEKRGLYLQPEVYYAFLEYYEKQMVKQNQQQSEKIINDIAGSNENTEH